MARTLDAELALRSLAPELTRRVRAAPAAAAGPLLVVTDAGSATLDIAADRVDVRPAAGHASSSAPSVELAQQELMHLILGTYPVDDVLDRLGRPPDEAARRWLRILFPQRQPYVHRPDWI
jgi:hypothetical protein